MFEQQLNQEETVNLASSWHKGTLTRVELFVELLLLSFPNTPNVDFRAFDLLLTEGRVRLTSEYSQQHYNHRLLIFKCIYLNV